MDITTVLLLAVPVLYALGLLATAVAKLTPNTTDDKVAAFLVWLHGAILAIVPSGLLPRPTATPKPPAPPLPPVVRSTK